MLAKYLPLAILGYKTTYHTSTGFEPGRKFRGRVPYNILDHRLGLKLITGLVATTHTADELLRRTQILQGKTKKKVMHSYIRFKKN